MVLSQKYRAEFSKQAVRNHVRELIKGLKCEAAGNPAHFCVSASNTTENLDFAKVSRV